MTATTAPARRSGLGLPALAGHRRLVAANLVDSIGNGMLLPLGLLYFTTVRHLPMATVGTAVTLGQLAALPVTLLAGYVMDRRSPKYLTTSANILSAAGFLTFLTARTAWQAALCYLLVQSGINAFYTAQRTLITHTTPPEQRRAWFAFMSSLRNAGIGAGAALATALLAAFGTRALTWLVALAAPLYLLAALCYAGLTTTPPPPAAEATTGNVTHTDHNRRYLLLVASTVPYVLAQAMLSVLVALYTTRSLHLPAYTAGVLLIVNTVFVSALGTPLNARLAHRSPRAAVALGYTLLIAAMALFALPALPLLGFTAWPALTAAVVVFSLAEVFISPAVNELSVTLTPQAAKGSRQSLFQLSFSAGFIAAPALFTTLLAHGQLLPWLAQAAACLLALAAVPALKAPNRHRRRNPRR
ncbi:MFS transporter [Streptomyces sp. NPDC007971]|uniref:MFS transporter n=1 Tax=Streptomyces sp. NPDC007971 TaxID=3364799 RepID=UPI0036E409FF